MAFSLSKIIAGDKGVKDRDALSSFLIESDKAVEFLSTGVINLNLGISGRVFGGIPKGKITTIAAASQSGKSFIAMSTIKSAQKAGMPVVIVDTERSFSFSMAKGLGVDTDPDKLSVFQTNSLEEVKSLIITLTSEIEKNERANLLLVIDSWGTLVTSKSVSDGMTGNDVVDMTEAKKKNNLANVLLNTGCTCFVINHVYDNVGSFMGGLKIPGGRRIYFVSEAVILGTSRAKEKSTDGDVTGIILSAQVEKSRYSKDASKFKFRIKRTGGLDTFYGLLDDALEAGVVVKPKNGKYSRPCVENDKEHKETDIYTKEFWNPIFKNTEFTSFLENKFRYSYDYDTSHVDLDTEEDDSE